MRVVVMRHVSCSAWSTHPNYLTDLLLGWVRFLHPGLTILSCPMLVLPVMFALPERFTSIIYMYVCKYYDIPGTID